MKDYANPVLLLAVIVLMACRASAESEMTAAQLDMWILTLCVTGMLVDGALALARALSHRPSLMSVVWAVAYLVLGCCTWAMSTVPMGEEQEAYRQLSQTQQDPLARDAEGESLLTRAAALGKEESVRDILRAVSPPLEHIEEAGLRAAEANKVAILDQLARIGLTARAAVNGVSLLHAAAQNGSCEAMEWLLERGAYVNGRDTEGSTPLIQATLSGSRSAVELLLRYGADKRLRDAAGKSAADYARDEEWELLLTPEQKPHRGER